MKDESPLEVTNGRNKKGFLENIPFHKTKAEEGDRVLEHRPQELEPPEKQDKPGFDVVPVDNDPHDPVDHMRVQEEVNKDQKLEPRPVDKNPVIEPTYDPNAPGEQGKGINIEKEKLSQEDKRRFDEGWKNNAYNQFASDMMSLHRSLPDVRDKE